MKLQIFLFRKKKNQTAHIHGMFGPGQMEAERQKPVDFRLNRSL